LLGDLMKDASIRVVNGGPDAISGFAKTLCDTKAANKGMSWCCVSTRVWSFDPPSERPFLFPELSWTWDTVPLDQCWVWAGMGGRKWAEGLVQTVAKKFCELPDQEHDRLHGMSSRWVSIP